MRTWTFLCLLFLTSCTGSRPGLLKADPRPSILVIAVDHLGSETIDCTKETKLGAQKSGFDILCREFSRWPHAYTTSTLAVPAMSSLLTGQYPASLGVRHNGQYLPPSFETAAEVAVKKGWSTQFISGGAPIVRKTGLNQGFESFDDNVRPNLEILYRPFFQSVQSYISAQKDLSHHLQMSFIYVTDLLFTKVQTRNSLGELRNLSYESQLEEFDENLGRLFEHLKKVDRWGNTVIIVVGLSALGKSLHPKVANPENLYSEKTQVALFTKGTSKISISSSEENISLADIGNTLLGLLGAPTATQDSAGFQITTLLKPPDTQPEMLRLIATESAWSFWQKKGMIEWAFRRGSILCIGLENKKCFDSVTDREEQLPISKGSAAKIAVPSALIDSVLKLTTAMSLPKPPELPIVKDLKSSPCFQLIQQARFSVSDLKKCDDSAVLDLAQWMSDDQNPQVELAQKELSKKKFIKSLWLQRLDHKVYVTNLELGEIWDVHLEKLVQKTILDEVFELSDVQKYKSQALRALSVEGDELARP